MDEQVHKGKDTNVDALKDSRAKILSATSPDILKQEISMLEAMLGCMSGETSGESKHSVDRALKVLESYKMHDKTRHDVACHVQTIICKLSNQQK